MSNVPNDELGMWGELDHAKQVGIEPTAPIDYDGLEDLSLDARLERLTGGPYSTSEGDAIRKHLEVLDELLDGISPYESLTQQGIDEAKERVQGVREIVADWEATLTEPDGLPF